MKSKFLSIRVDESLHQKANDTSNERDITLADFVRQAVCDACHTSSHATEGDNQQSVEILQEQVANQKQQINVKDEQIERLQSALDQSQQLQALTENRYQAEHQQLSEIKGRSFLQRLKAVLVANP